MAARSPSGSDVVQAWADTLPSGAAIVDVGAGHGMPLTAILVKKGLRVSAIDASPTLVEAFRQTFPDLESACERAERSSFFGRKFDAALAVGLIFLLPEEGQKALIDRMASALKPGGKLLFSAPWQVGSWEDLLTKQTSWSLGAEAYEKMLIQAGFQLSEKMTDAAGTHYYEAKRL